mgnify:CR=1 FL=1
MVIELQNPTNELIEKLDCQRISYDSFIEERNEIESIGAKIIYTSDEKLSTTEIVRPIRENAKRGKRYLFF